jgi:hypothetical protein
MKMAEDIVRYGAGGVPYVGPKTAVEPAPEPEPEEKEKEISLEENPEWDAESGSFKEKE